ncbi:MAG: DUF4147 domain-containing protein [Pirellulaceae bacterium]|nr:DUF4147 domain-containing protein [Pirellulaceae bacterium]
MKGPVQLRRDAVAIWKAGVDAVGSHQLVQNVFSRAGDRLTVCGEQFSLRDLRRIAVVGAGKAGAGMAEAVERVLGPDLVADKVRGWVNVPADCVRNLQRIHLHAARPAGLNEPTAEGVEGTSRILDLVAELEPDDLCLVLISGGGSALLPAPLPPITLADKQAVTRFLMRSGASIRQLNAVRKRLSRIKGGGLARASRAGRTIALIISDIVGDPLDMIASGPTYPDATTDADALEVLRQFEAAPPQVPARVLEFLEAAATRHLPPEPFPHRVSNHVIGNNRTALAAAARNAQALGYHVILLGSDHQGEVNDEGRRLALRCRALRDGVERGQLFPVCLLSGGEPTVRLAVTDQPRQGGRNQQLVLAGLDALWDHGMRRIMLLSGGTDGEDGPTNAAGAWADADLLDRARERRLEPLPYLEINNSYAYFEQLDGLLVTGPTHTNVMDLRVALVDSAS